MTGAAPLRVLLVDDEPLARTRLRGLVDDCAWPAARVVAEAGSAAETLHLLAREAVDLLLLDIGMPGLDGLALARRLKERGDPPALVFVTAHAEHALDAFDLAAVDYLTKPVRRARLHEALGRVAARRPVSAGVAAGVPEATPPAESEPAILVHQRGLRLRVPVSEVLYLRAEQKYVTVRTALNSHVIDESLTELEPRLGPAFLRVHRNALVAKAAMRELLRRRADDGDDDAADGGEGWAVRVAPVDEWLAVSRRQAPLVKDVLAGGVV